VLAFPPSQPSLWAGKERRPPPREREGLGWGLLPLEGYVFCRAHSPAENPSRKCAPLAGKRRPIFASTHTPLKKTCPSNTNRKGRVDNSPSPAGSPRFARGTKPLGSPCEQGEPRGGGLSTAAFCKLWFGDWYKPPLPQEGEGDKGGEGKHHTNAVLPGTATSSTGIGPNSSFSARSSRFSCD